MAKFLDDTGLGTLWAKIKATFVKDVKIDGTSVVSSGTASIPMASSSTKGVVKVDDAMSSSSTNPVQNKVVNSAINAKANDSDVVHKSGNENVTDTKTFKNLTIFEKVHRDEYYASNVCRHFSGNTPTEFAIWSKIKFVSGSHMPVVRVYGYAYGLQSPIELKIGFYIFNNELGWCGCINQGAWQPDVYLWKYTKDEVDYVAIGLKGSCYFCGFQVDIQIGASGSFETVLTEGWTTSHNGADTTQTIIPAEGTDKCIKVYYKTIKTSISGGAGYLNTIRSIKVDLGSTSAAWFNGEANVTPGVYGRLPDANIASASTWNAKQSALPTSGTASTTYAINVSGSSASCTGNAATATAFSSGTAKTKFDGISEGANKVEASSTNGNVKIDGTETTVYTHPTQTAYASKGSATKVPQITTDGTGHVTGITEVTISGVTPAAHTHTADAADVVDQQGDSAITDSTDIITTHVNGYSSTNKKLYRRNFKDYVWPWIKDKISSVLGLSTTGYTGNAATATKATQDSDGNTINATYFKSSGNTTLVAGAATKIGTQNGADVKLTLPAHQDISGKMATDCSNKASGALQNLTAQLTQGTDPFTDGTEIFSSYANDNGFATTGHVNQPYRRQASAMWSYIKTKLGISSGKGGSDTPVYFNSDGQATTCNEMLRKNGGNATDTCMNALLMALPTWTATPTDDTYLVRRDAGGAQSFGQVKFSTVWSYIYNKLFYAKNPADSSQNTHKRIQLGYAAVGGSDVGFCCYLVHIFFNYVDGSLKGCGVTALVTLDWRTSESRLAKLCIVNDNGMSAAGYNIVLANFLTDSGANLHITIGLVKKSASTTLVQFSYSYCRIVPISNGMNWTHSVASDTVGTYDFLIQGTYEDAGNADSVDGYHIEVGSYSSRTDTISLY